MARVLTIRIRTIFGCILLMVIGGCSWQPFWEKPVEQALPDLGEIEKRLYDEFRLWQGTPYSLGGNNSKGIDCSGFVAKVFQKVFGIGLPRYAIQQAETGVPVSKDQLRAADLVFFSQFSKKINHVGIYLKDGKFVHASTSKGVTLSRLDIGYWKKAYHTSRRIVNRVR